MYDKATHDVHGIEMIAVSAVGEGDRAVRGSPVIDPDSDTTQVVDGE